MIFFEFIDLSRFGHHFQGMGCGTSKPTYDSSAAGASGDAAPPIAAATPAPGAAPAGPKAGLSF